MKCTDDISFSIAPLSDDVTEARAASSLLKEVFGDNCFNEAHWKWKYNTNPFGPPILVAAWAGRREDGNMAGFRAFWRWRFVRERKVVQAAQPCDTAVSSSYRRRGLFSRMTKVALDLASKEGIGVLFNNPNPESRAGYLKIGWHDAQGIRWFAKPVKKIKVMKEVLRWGRNNPPINWTRPEKVWKGEVDEDILHPLLVEAAKENGDILFTSRDAQFYRWRYTEAPHRTYGALFSIERGIYQGLLIYGTGQRGRLREVQILDFITVRHDSKGAGALVNRLIQTEQPDWITCAATPAFPYIADIRKAGFLALPRTASIMVNFLQGAASVPVALTLGDIDTF